MKNEKNHEKLKKNSKKIFQEKEKERKNLEVMNKILLLFHSN